MNKYHILIVDDDLNRCRVLDYRLKKFGYKTTYTTNPKDALEKFKDENIDLVISDIKMQEMSGIELLKKLKEIDPLVNVILITAFGKTQELLLEALRNGAFDFLEKVEDSDYLIEIVERGLKNRDEKLNYLYLKEKVIFEIPSEFIGEDEKIKKILKNINDISKTDSTVLITGESGTGKELIARMIHKNSKRRDNNFVSFNCAALNPNLIESELFGYKKGAFTGAYTNKDGLIKVADMGTLFLDEISEMDISLQAKLLRVLQEREVVPVGSTDPIPVDVRIISATNKNIDDEVKKNNFRLDLFYRLNVIRIDLPPLRERKEDIPKIFDYYVDFYSKKMGKVIKRIDPSVYDLLKDYSWPGNVRELMNIVERIIVIKDNSEIKKSDIPQLSILKVQQTSKGFTPQKIDDVEKKLIEDTLKFYNYDKKQASIALGINISTLYRKIKDYRIEES
uniref:Sigma-54-dependent Fis family transcriptional regulator n=1 Tax=candidate division WOR-3 bacterium TaxID=2052148 RepID=A0A7C3J672_UNCW3